MELFKASRQWATRPDDERFASLGELHDACMGYQRAAREARVYYRDLHPVVVPGSQGDEVGLVGMNGTTARLSHWAFGQVCARSKAPASFLRELPPALVVPVLENRMRARGNGDECKVMFHQNGGLLTRCLTGVDYTRVWNSDITARLFPLKEDGWQVPPARPARPGQSGTRPATQEDVLAGDAWSLSINVGDLIAPAGLYASDHDLFVFMVDQRHPIVGPDGQPLFKGFIAWNSEVGDKSFGLLTFRYRHVCGNHIVWDAKDAIEVRLRHVGEVNDRAFRAMRVELRQYSESAASEDEGRIQRSAVFEIAGTKDQVLDAIWKRRIPNLSQANIRAAYESTEALYPVDGNPRTAWGMAQGLTRLSQVQPYAEDRVNLDRAAGKVLAIGF